MDIGKNQGIILHQFFPKKQKVIVFDREQGPLEAIPDSGVSIERLCPGALLVYVLVQKRNNYFLKAIDLLDMPLNWARYDILFLHHVLELCNYFLPHAVNNHFLFDHLVALYQSPNVRATSLGKKLFLVKFFVAIGIYAEQTGLSSQTLERLVYEPIDVIVPDNLHLEDDVDRWLWQCLHMHPQFGVFKTVHFLNR